MASLQIYDGTEWRNYITNDDNYDYNFIGNYYGSSSRIGSLGTLLEGNTSHAKHIRIINEESRICEFYVTKKAIDYAIRPTAENSDNITYAIRPVSVYPTLEVYDNTTNITGKITLRDLHLFPMHPYEISKMTITM